MSTPYQPPVAGLLELGEDALTEEWIDYLALGLGPEHVPDLIRMATDERLNEGESERPETWAPVQAWRALGRLRAEPAVEPLLELAGKLEDEIFVDPELARVLGMIGRAAIPALARVIADDSADPALHILATQALDEVVAGDESARDEVVPLLVARLETWDRNDDVLNTFLVDALTGLRVMEAAPLMEQAFAAHRVDLVARGDWEDVQVELGLLEKRRTPSPRVAARDPFSDEPFVSGPAPWLRPPDSKAKKNKRKQQKESRKKNRRRK